MRPIAIFYHTLFQLGDELLPSSMGIVNEQMEILKSSGLMDAAQRIIVGVNGGDESRIYAESLLPQKALVIYHGLQCKNECRTICEMERFSKESPDTNVLYFHAKGASRSNGMVPTDLPTKWRRCMMKSCVWRWRECVGALENGYEAVGAHWMTNQGSDLSQNFFAGTFFWATSGFLATIPSMHTRTRIKMSGIDSADSRYEAEVWIGTGRRLPKVRDMEPMHRVRMCP